MYEDQPDWTGTAFIGAVFATLYTVFLVYLPELLTC